MGQQIYFISTPNYAKISIDIVHFIENNHIIIPLLIDEFDFNRIIETKDIKNVNDFFEEAIRHFTFEYTAKKVFDLLEEKKINTFALFGYREVLDIPEIDDAIIFINGIRINPELDANNQKKSENLKYNFPSQSIIGNESKYWNYYSAEKIYFDELEKLITPKNN